MKGKMGIIIAAAILVFVSGILLKNSMKEERIQLNSEIFAVKDTTVEAVEDIGETDTNQAEENKQEDAEENWTMPVVKMIYDAERSEEKRAEEIEPEEALEIAVKTFENVWGINCADKEIYMRLTKKGDIRVYKGEIADDNYCSYLLWINSVDGEVIRINGGLFLASQELLHVDYEEYVALQKEFSEKREQEKSEKWMSTNEFMELVNPLVWNKITKQIIADSGLNRDKTMNTVNVLEYFKGRVITECYLDEMQGETEVLILQIDLRSKKLIEYWNKTNSM